MNFTNEIGKREGAENERRERERESVCLCLNLPHISCSSSVLCV